MKIINKSHFDVLKFTESGYKGPVISQKPDSVTTVEGKAAVFSCSLADAADSGEFNIALL